MTKTVVNSLFIVLVILAVFQIYEGFAAHTTSAPPITTHSPVTIVVGRNNMAFIIRSDGCYQMHINQQQSHALRSHHGHEREQMEAQLSALVDKATSIHEVDHHLIDHESTEIQTHCLDLPVFRFTVTNDH